LPQLDCVEIQLWLKAMMKPDFTFKQIKAYDDSRAGVPGEHWMALGLGLAAWLMTRKNPSFLVRTAGVMAGTALVGRAASGRDGVSRLLQYLPIGRRKELRR
jgi:hypothetical protein